MKIIKNNIHQYGTSSSLCDYILINQIKEIQPKEVVDFGAGAGKNGGIVREILGNDCVLIAVEGCEKTARMLIDSGPYNEVQNSLLQDWIHRDNNKYELAIFGDVLEHLTPREIKNVIRNCYSKFDNIIINVPLHDLFQDDFYGNPLEVHKTYITIGYFNRYDPIEKHIISSNKRTIMNIRIATDWNKNPLYRRAALKIFHYCMIIFQPIGLARPIVNFLKRYFIRYKWLLRS